MFRVTQSRLNLNSEKKKKKINVQCLKNKMRYFTCAVVAIYLTHRRGGEDHFNPDMYSY